MRSSAIANQLIIFSIVLLGLYVGKNLFIPFVIAIVFWYLLNSLASLVGRIKIGGRSLPRLVQHLVGLVFLVSAVFFIAHLVADNYEVFLTQYPVYLANLNNLMDGVGDWLNLSPGELTQSLDIPAMLAEYGTGAIDSSLGFVSGFFLVILYVIFLLLEQQVFESKLKLIFKERSDYVRFFALMRKIDSSVHSYVSIKTGLCLLAAVFSYIILIIVGVDFAVLWALVIFLFNFIPIIGAFIGVLFPALIAVVQFGEYAEPLIVVSLLSAVQLVIGNFIEPKILGQRLNLSPLVVILALSFWGALWGVAGMFLCVPITVIMMIVFSQFEQTKNIAILLSGGKGV